MLIHRIVCVGVNFRTAPIEYREQLGRDLAVLCERACAGAYRASNGDGQSIRELAWLSTCNRVELYALASEDGASAPLVAILAAAGGLDPRDVATHTYRHVGYDAVRHLCRVASGLDSMVLGEPQILGQVARALDDARSRRTAGPVLNRVFRRAVRTGRRARSETSIGRNPASMSSMAVALAGSVVGPLRDRRVLVIGLGEMGSVTVKALRARQVREIAVANRTLARAEEVSARWQHRAYPMDELAAALEWADVVISATRSPQVIVDRMVVADVVARRDGRPLVFVDIAVPRDIEPAVRDLPDVHLFDADDLSGKLDVGLAARRNEIPRVERIVDDETTSFEAEMHELEFDSATPERLQTLSHSIVNHPLR